MSKLSSDLAISILEAGNGTRMKSSLPKWMHQVANKEMVNWVIDCAKELAPKEIIAVINPAMNKDAELKAKINANFAVQKEQKGTADAFKSGLAALKTKPGKILILTGIRRCLPRRPCKRC